MNSSVLPILRVLSEGQVWSRGQLAAQAGLSAEEIDSAVIALGEAGMLSTESHGLRLRAPVSLLDKDRIGASLGSLASTLAIEVVAETTSTNDDLMQRARNGENGPIARVAEIQTAGRGRRQRQWHSLPGGALTFSLLRRFDCGPDGLLGLPLVVGVALARALHAVGAMEVKLKWPNDLIVGRAKLGGILVETLRKTDGTTAAVVGAGINVRLTSTLLRQIDQSAIDLASLGVAVDRNQLLAGVLVELHAALDRFAREGFVALKDDWQQLHAYQDKIVRLNLPDGTQLEGILSGVDDNGALLLRTGNDVRVFHSGEISLRAVSDDC